MSGETPPEVWADLAVSLLEMDLRDALEAVTVPALVIVGALDRLTPVSAARSLSERLPSGRLVVLPETGHAAPIERPDAWNEAVEGFLAEVQSASRRRQKATA